MPPGLSCFAPGGKEAASQRWQVSPRQPGTAPKCCLPVTVPERALTRAQSSSVPEAGSSGQWGQEQSPSPVPRPPVTAIVGGVQAAPAYLLAKEKSLWPGAGCSHQALGKGPNGPACALPTSLATGACCTPSSLSPQVPCWCVWSQCRGGERWEGMEQGERDCSRAAAECTSLSLCARQVSVGVSSGTAFCGLTGHPERFEHTGRAPLS